MPTADPIARTAREALGFKRLRPGQREAIESVLEGRDTLVVMSTGFGKSAIYQIAGALIPGPTLVVSPLIALQQDQVEAIERRLPGEAAELNSSVAAGARREALDDLEGGALEYLFLAPEQLANADVLEEVRAAGPSLLVVDEAHCISEWGHDFRPDYMRLGAVVEQLGHPTVLALTATASPPVRAEIVERLAMRDPEIIVRGFDRPSLHLAVERFHDERRKHEALLQRVQEAERPGIVYAATRAGTDEIAEALIEGGLRAAAYHAGLRPARREEIQEHFMRDELDVIVATTAFGMGVDKPNVRFVFHHDIAESIDSYYQEIGRAGRDEKPADAVLFYRPEDLGLRRFFGGSGRAGVDGIEQVARAIESQDGPVEPGELAEDLELSESKLLSAVNRLEDAGSVEVLPSGEVAPTEDGLAPTDAVEEAVEAEDQRHAFDRSRLEMMRGYAEHAGCRRAFILSYFGESTAAHCGNCDNCDAGRTSDAVEDDDALPFPVGSRVRHSEWAEGVVQRYDGAQMVVLFDSVGYRTLAVDVVRERGLLEAAQR
jgi:ATP-dependent DNA helicase RecQ